MENLNQRVELTNLKSNLRDGDVESLIQTASKHNFLGICIPPFWVKKAKRDVGGLNLKVITVAGFPFGFHMSQTKMREIEQAIQDGADEVDMVWSLTAYKSGMNWPKIEIAKAAQLCHEAKIVLKVIIETALLDQEEIAEASKISADAGADFVKTSTGFSSRGASIEDIEIMSKNVPPEVGIKASGGINTLKFAEELILAGASRIGSSSADQWFS